MFKILNNYTINESLEKIKDYHSNKIIDTNDDFFNLAFIIEVYSKESVCGILLFKNNNGLSPLIIERGSIILIGYDDNILIIDTDKFEQLHFQKLYSIIIEIKLFSDFIVILMETDLLVMNYCFEEIKKVKFCNTVFDYFWRDNYIDIVTDDTIKYHIFYD